MRALRDVVLVVLWFAAPVVAVAVLVHWALEVFGW